MSVSRLVTRALTSSETEEGRNGDSAWPLWGLAMRLIQAVSVARGDLRDMC